MKYGIQPFSMLGGMFAFSIHDKKTKKILITRYFFGEKPLYYLKDIDSLMWASELKSIIKILPVKPAINKPALNLFFN
jgi:asparagine synthase (glutamine-hydrolysing)